MDEHHLYQLPVRLVERERESGRDRESERERERCESKLRGLGNPLPRGRKSSAGKAGRKHALDPNPEPRQNRVSGLEFRVQGSGFRVQGSGFRVQGTGFRVQGSGFRVQGSGLRVEG